MLSFKKLSPTVSSPIVDGDIVYIYAHEDVSVQPHQTCGVCQVKTGLELRLADGYCAYLATTSIRISRDERSRDSTSQKGAIFNDSLVGEFIVPLYWEFQEEEDLTLRLLGDIIITKGYTIATLTIQPIARIAEVQEF